MQIFGTSPFLGNIIKTFIKNVYPEFYWISVGTEWNFIRVEC